MPSLRSRFSPQAPSSSCDLLTVTREGDRLRLRCDIDAVTVTNASRLLAALAEIDWKEGREASIDRRRVRSAGTVLVAILTILGQLATRHRVRLRVGPTSAAVDALLWGAKNPLSPGVGYENSAEALMRPPGGRMVQSMG